MISALFVINALGDVIISRIFREDVKRAVTDVFYSKIIDIDPNELKNPVLTLGSTSFLYIKRGEIYYVAVTRNNSDVSIILQYLNNIIKILQSLISLSADTNLLDYQLMDNFLLIYEILDLTIDQGFVREMDENNLISQIQSPISKSSSIDIGEIDNNEVEIIRNDIHLITTKDMLDFDNFGKNEVVLCMNEYINAKTKKDITLKGEIFSVSTMPSNMSINFKFASIFNKPSIDFDNLTVSKDILVKESKYDALLNLSMMINKSVQPILQYSINIPYTELPLSITGSYNQVGRDKFEIKLRLDINIPTNIFARNVVINIPVPKNTLKVDDIYSQNPNQDMKFLDHSLEGYLIWQFDILEGGKKFDLSKIVHVDLSSKLSEWLTSRDNVCVSFKIDNFNLSKSLIKSFNVDKSFENITNKYIKMSTISKSCEFTI